MAQIENVRCPMMQEEIDISYCFELQMIAGGDIKPTIHESCLTKEHFQICKQCKKREKLM